MWREVFICMYVWNDSSISHSWLDLDTCAVSVHVNNILVIRVWRETLNYVWKDTLLYMCYMTHSWLNLDMCATWVQVNDIFIICVQGDFDVFMDSNFISYVWCIFSSFVCRETLIIYELNLSCIRVTWLIHDSILIYVQLLHNGTVFCSLVWREILHHMRREFWIHTCDMTHSWLSLDICAASVQAIKNECCSLGASAWYVLKVRVTLKV